MLTITNMWNLITYILGEESCSSSGESDQGDVTAVPEDTDDWIQHHYPAFPRDIHQEINPSHYPTATTALGM